MCAPDADLRPTAAQALAQLRSIADVNSYAFETTPTKETHFVRSFFVVVVVDVACSGVSNGSLKTVVAAVAVDAAAARLLSSPIAPVASSAIPAATVDAPIAAKHRQRLFVFLVSRIVMKKTTTTTHIILRFIVALALSLATTRRAFSCRCCKLRCVSSSSATCFF